jgi:hypothetical protein
LKDRVDNTAKASRLIANSTNAVALLPAFRSTLGVCGTLSCLTSPFSLYFSYNETADCKVQARGDDTAGRAVGQVL